MKKLKSLVILFIFCLSITMGCNDNQTDDHKPNDNPAEGLGEIETEIDNTSIENSELHQGGIKATPPDSVKVK